MTSFNSFIIIFLVILPALAVFVIPDSVLYSRQDMLQAGRSVTSREEHQTPVFVPDKHSYLPQPTAFIRTLYVIFNRGSALLYYSSYEQF